MTTFFVHRYCIQMDREYCANLKMFMYTKDGTHARVTQITHVKFAQNIAHVRFFGIVGILNFYIGKISAKTKSSPFGKTCT